MSFKLDRLALENGFTARNAHDALGDVEATIHLATIIRNHAPAVWARCLRNRDNHEVASTLQNGYPLHLIERFGAAPPRSFVGVYAGTNPQNKNAMGFLDLDAGNVAEIVDADDEALMNAVSGTPKLIRSVSTNKAPNIFPITNPDPEHVAAAKLIAARPDFLERVGQALADRFADQEEPSEVEKQIYGGFYSVADKHILQEFEHVGWRHRADLITKLEDHRLRQLGQRLIYWNAPKLVSAHYVSAAQAAIRERWLSNDPDAPWTTMAEVEKQLCEIDTASLLSEGELNALRRFYRIRGNSILNKRQI